MGMIAAPSEMELFQLGLQLDYYPVRLREKDHGIPVEDEHEGKLGPEYLSRKRNGDGDEEGKVT